MNSRYERSTDVLYRLTAIYYENKKYARYPRFKVWRHTYGYFHTLDETEALMRKEVDKHNKNLADGWDIYHYYGFEICKIPFNQKLCSKYDTLCTRTYLEDGSFFSETMVSSIESTNYSRGYEPFKGRATEECRFKVGDLVDDFRHKQLDLLVMPQSPYSDTTKARKLPDF